VSIRPGTFLKNIALFFFGFLPAVAIANMALNAVLGDRVPTSPDWEIGWNPILWFIMTAPWLVPTVVIVPLLYILAKVIVRRFSRPVARGVLLGASPACCMGLCSGFPITPPHRGNHHPQKEKQSHLVEQPSPAASGQPQDVVTACTQEQGSVQ